VDEDYRGEVKVLLVNHGKKAFTVSHGERIAQLVVSKVEKPEVEEVRELEGTERGIGGFGSTGV
jgi:dUTP pyrophosphatase